MFLNSLKKLESIVMHGHSTKIISIWKCKMTFDYMCIKIVKVGKKYARYQNNILRFYIKTELHASNVKFIYQ